MKAAPRKAFFDPQATQTRLDQELAQCAQSGEPDHGMFEGRLAEARLRRWLALSGR